jgi:hypothetical protein
VKPAASVALPSAADLDAHAEEERVKLATSGSTQFGLIAAKISAALATPASPAAPPKTSMEAAAEFVNDLMGRYISVEEIPEPAQHGKLGRIGVLFQELLATPPDRAYTVSCHNRELAARTMGHLMKKVRVKGLSIAGRRIGMVCYFHWVKEAVETREEVA